MCFIFWLDDLHSILLHLVLRKWYYRVFILLQPSRHRCAAIDLNFKKCVQSTSIDGPLFDDQWKNNGKHNFLTYDIMPDLNMVACILGSHGGVNFQVSGDWVFVEILGLGFTLRWNSKVNKTWIF